MLIACHSLFSLFFYWNFGFFQFAWKFGFHISRILRLFHHIFLIYPSQSFNFNTFFSQYFFNEAHAFQVLCVFFTTYVDSKRKRVSVTGYRTYFQSSDFCSFFLYFCPTLRQYIRKKTIQILLMSSLSMKID